MEWPTPPNVHEVCTFMGLVGYYGIFLEVFLNIANLVTELQTKNKKFIWME